MIKVDSNRIRYDHFFFYFYRTTDYVLNTNVKFFKRQKSKTRSYRAIKLDFDKSVNKKTSASLHLYRTVKSRKINSSKILTNISYRSLSASLKKKNTKGD